MRKSTDWFRVNEFKALNDPGDRLARKELLVPLSAYPDDFGLGPNPREPKVSSKVSKRIGDTLESNPENFHLLNRGITIVAQDIEYDNQSKKVRLDLGEGDEAEELYGILDGGNTNARIKLWRGDLDDESVLAKTFVNVQVLLPKYSGQNGPSREMLSLLNDVKQARNTSVQVTEKSLADARKHFDLMKEVLGEEPYSDGISWHEGQKGTIDALDIVSLLMVAYPRYTEDSGGDEPHLIYGHKSRALDAFLKYKAEQPEELEQWIKVMPSLVNFFDHLQCDLPIKYEGKFGRITGVRIHDEAKYEPGNKRYSKVPFKTKFRGEIQKYRYPFGFVYPVYAGFRVLLRADEDTGAVTWKKDPVIFWNQHGSEIVRQYKPHMESTAFDSKKIAQSPTSYQAVRHTITDLYKDELLKSHGIPV